MKKACALIVLLVLGGGAMSQTTAVHPRVTVPAIVRAPTSVLTEVERLNAAATASQSEFMSSRPPARKEALTAYTKSDIELEMALYRSWAAMPFAPRRTLIIQEPLALAMLNWEIWVRRLVGPTLRTRVPNLRDSVGCQGDFVANRLMHHYAEAVSSLVIGTDPVSTSAEALHHIAVQISCLSQPQLAKLDLALVVAFDAVTERMRSARLEALIPAFARLAAPLEVLMLDARKHRGEKSSAWQWFHSYGQTLKEDVSRAGWPSGKVFLWDRVSGKLDGFPSCARNLSRPDCVSLPIFIDSLMDPRALGLGTCSFAAMVSRGADNLSLGPVTRSSGSGELSSPRYTCPMNICAGGTGSGRVPESLLRDIPLAMGAKDRLKSLWPTSLTTASTAAMGRLCTPSAEQAQILSGQSEQCFITPTSNPFDTYAACTLAAAGGGIVPEVGQSFRGVPMGLACGVSQEGGQPTPPPPEPAPPPEDDECSICDWVIEYIVDLGKTIAEVAGAVLEHGSGAAAIGAARAVGAATPLLGSMAKFVTPEMAGLPSGIMTVILQMTLRGLGATDPDEASRLAGEADRRGGGARVTEELQRRRQGANDCFDAGSCKSSCTALGQQLEAANACSKGLLTPLQTLAGLPPREVPGGRPMGPVIRTDRESPVATNPADYCYIGTATNPNPQNLACGLQLCVGGHLSSASANACICSGTSASRLEPLPVICRERCSPDQIQSADCSCTSLERPATPPDRPTPPIPR